MDKRLIRTVKRDKFIWSCIILLDLFLVFLVDSTWDGGDSILHYVESHQALQTPHYFMNMWSKPIFILLSFPFSALGWWGMKLFNSICILVSVALVKRIFEYYALYGWWGVFISFFAYSLFLSQSSGLTEPLFTVLLTIIVYFELNDKTLHASLVLSFLPFVRSEGYVICIIFLVYLLFSKRFKYIAHLSVGHVVYGIVGLFVYSDFLWMFNQNPYSGIEEKYGSGDIFHFVEQLPYMIGLPIYILFFLGVFRGGLRFFKGEMLLKEFILIYGVTIGYIVAHSIFWRYGLFHSYGLSRVLLVIIPLIAFIAYRGLQWLHCALYFFNKKYINTITIILIAVFPFIKNKMAIDWDKDIKQEHQQVLVKQSNDWITATDGYKNLPIYTNAYYHAVVSGKIIDNETEILELKTLKKPNHKPKKGNLILWDSFFAPTDGEVSQKFIESNYNIRKLREFKNDKDYRLVIYQVL